MEDNGAELARLKAAVEAAEAETASVRTKLHSAIRKGRAIESEKNSKAARLDALEQQITDLRAARDSGVSHQEAPQAQQRQIEALKVQLQQAQELSETQAKEAHASAEGQSRELKSRGDYIDKLEDLLKARQRALAEKQGECVMAQAAAEGYKQDAEAAAAKLQQPSSQQSASSDGAADRSAPCGPLLRSGHQ